MFSVFKDFSFKSLRYNYKRRNYIKKYNFQTALLNLNILYSYFVYYHIFFILCIFSVVYWTTLIFFCFCNISHEESFTNFSYLKMYLKFTILKYLTNITLEISKFTNNFRNLLNLEIGITEKCYLNGNILFILYKIIDYILFCQKPC